MFWKNCLGLRTYKGWYGFLSGEQNATKSEFDPYLKSLLEWLREYRSLDTVTLLLPAENRQNLAVYATIGLEEEIVQQIRIPLGQGIAGSIAASGKPMIVNDLSEVEVFSPVLRQKGLQSLVGIPLLVNQDLVGVLHFGTFQSHQFTERDMEELENFAHHLGSIMTGAGIFNFEWDGHNQEFCLENKGMRKNRFSFNTLYRSFMLNLSALGLRVFKGALSPFCLPLQPLVIFASNF